MLYVQREGLQSDIFPKARGQVALLVVTSKNKPKTQRIVLFVRYMRSSRDIAGQIGTPQVLAGVRLTPLSSLGGGEVDYFRYTSSDSFCWQSDLYLKGVRPPGRRIYPRFFRAGGRRCIRQANQPTETRMSLLLTRNYLKLSVSGK